MRSSSKPGLYLSSNQMPTRSQPWSRIRKIQPADQAMVPAGRNRARAMSRKLTTTHISAFIARVIGYLFLWGRCTINVYEYLGSPYEMGRAGSATARVLRATHEASNPLAPPARVPAHQQIGRAS